MESKNKYEKMYHILIEYERKNHAKNQRRIHYGIWCMFLVPMIFLSMLFWFGGSKVIYMTLWIGSLFVICGYLVLVEYADTKIQKLLKEVEASDNEEVDALIGQKFDEFEAKAAERGREVAAAIEDRKVEMAAKIEDRKVEMAEKIEDRKAEVAAKIEDRKTEAAERRAQRQEAIATAIEEKKSQAQETVEDLRTRIQAAKAERTTEDQPAEEADSKGGDEL